MRGSRTDVIHVQPGARIESRESELARAHVRASSSLSRTHLHIRRIAALIHREDAVGIIAQRILSGDPKATEIINSIITSMWVDLDENNKPSIGGAIDLFGWSVVREIALTAMLHQVHVELTSGTGINPVELDRQALSVLAAAVHFGADPFAALLANLGIAGLIAMGGVRYVRIRQSDSARADDLSFAERAEFGFDHATFGAAMLWEADVPDRVCQSVASHSAVGSPIWLAEEVSTQIGFDGGLKRTGREICPDFLRRYGVTESRLERIKTAMNSAAGLPEFYFTTNISSAVA